MKIKGKAVTSFRLTKHFVAIDLGSHSLKVAEYQWVGDKVTLLHYEIVPLPPGRGPAGQPEGEVEASLVRQTVKKMKAKASKAACEVGGPWTVARHLFFPDLPDEEMREGIRWGSRAEFPFALEEALIDFSRLEVFRNIEGEAEAEIVVTAATRRVVEQRLELLKKSGLKPHFITHSAFSLMQAYRFTQSAPWKETVVVLDIGHKSSKIVILKEGKLKFFREIAVAGDFFTQALVGTQEVQNRVVEVDEVTAERVKRRYGLVGESDGEGEEDALPGEWVQKRLGAVADRLLLELERSLNYYKNQFKDYEIHRIITVGGGSRLKGLKSYLRQALEIPVQPLDGFGPLNLKKKIKEDQIQGDLPLLTTLIGLASQSRPWIDLASQLLLPQAEKKSLKQKTQAALVLLIPLGTAVFFLSQYVTVKQKANRLKTDLAAKNQQLARLDRAMEELARLEREEAELDAFLTQYPPLKISDPYLLHRFLKDLPALVPPSVMLTRLRIVKRQDPSVEPGSEKETNAPIPEGEERKNPATILSVTGRPRFVLEMQGTVFSGEGEILTRLTDLLGRLKKYGLLEEVKIRSTTKNEEYAREAIDFLIEAKVRDEEKVEGPRQGLRMQDRKKEAAF